MIKLIEMPEGSYSFFKRFIEGIYLTISFYLILTLVFVYLKNSFVVLYISIPIVLMAIISQIKKNKIFITKILFNNIWEIEYMSFNKKKKIGINPKDLKFRIMQLDPANFNNKHLMKLNFKRTKILQYQNKYWTYQDMKKIEVFYLSLQH